VIKTISEMFKYMPIASLIRILTVQKSTEIHPVKPEIHIYVKRNRSRERRPRTKSK